MVRDQEKSKSKRDRDRHRGQPEIEQRHVKSDGDQIVRADQQDHGGDHVGAQMDSPEAQRRIGPSQRGTKPADLNLDLIDLANEARVFLNQRADQPEVAAAALAGQCEVVEILSAKRTFHGTAIAPILTV